MAVLVPPTTTIGLPGSTASRTTGHDPADDRHHETDHDHHDDHDDTTDHDHGPGDEHHPAPASTSTTTQPAGPTLSPATTIHRPRPSPTTTTVPVRPRWDRDRPRPLAPGRPGAHRRGGSGVRGGRRRGRRGPRGSTTPASVATSVTTSTTVPSTATRAMTTAAPTTAAASFASTPVRGARSPAAGPGGDPVLAEASGLVASHANAGVLWAIADSGSPARLVAIDLTGATVATVDVTGAENVDWEDIALLRGPDRLVVADTGRQRRGARHRGPGRGARARPRRRQPRRSPGPRGPRRAVGAGMARRGPGCRGRARRPHRGDIVVLSKHLLGGSEVMAVPADAVGGSGRHPRAGGGVAHRPGGSGDGGRCVRRRRPPWCCAPTCRCWSSTAPRARRVAQALAGTPCQAVPPPRARVRPWPCWLTAAAPSPCPRGRASRCGWCPPAP